MLETLATQYFNEVSRIAEDIQHFSNNIQQYWQTIDEEVDNVEQTWQSYFDKDHKSLDGILQDLETACRTTFSSYQRLRQETEQFYETPTEPVQANDTYTAQIQTVSDNTLQEILEGKQTYEEDGETKTAWTWNERERLIQEYLKENNPSDEALRQARHAIEDHDYLEEEHENKKKRLENVLRSYEKRNQNL